MKDWSEDDRKGENGTQRMEAWERVTEAAG